MRLGTTPDPFTVALVRNQDFVTAIDAEDATGAPQAWPDGATLELVFSDSDKTRLPAVIIGAAAEWNVDKGMVNALIDRFGSGLPQAQLVYTEGALELIPFAGNVEVTG